MHESNPQLLIIGDDYRDVSTWAAAVEHHARMLRTNYQRVEGRDTGEDLTNWFHRAVTLRKKEVFSSAAKMEAAA